MEGEDGVWRGDGKSPPGSFAMGHGDCPTTIRRLHDSNTAVSCGRHDRSLRPPHKRSKTLPTPKRLETKNLAASRGRHAYEYKERRCRLYSFFSSLDGMKRMGWVGKTGGEEEVKRRCVCDVTHLGPLGGLLVSGRTVFLFFFMSGKYNICDTPVYCPSISTFPFPSPCPFPEGPGYPSSTPLPSVPIFLPQLPHGFQSSSRIPLSVARIRGKQTSHLSSASTITTHTGKLTNT